MKKSNCVDYKKQIRDVFLCGLLTTSVIFCSGCSGSLKLSSIWQQDDIAIDGNGTEWKDDLYYDKKSDAVYGIRNNDDYVYLLLKTQNRSAQMQIMRAGFTVWFDASGGNDHSFGIRYPLAGKEPDLEYRPGYDNEKIHSFIDRAPLELEILGAQKEDIQQYSTLDVPGIRVKISRLQDVLLYELRVPLRKTPHTPFAIGAASVNRIGIGLETEEFSHDKMKIGAHRKDRLSESKSIDSQMGDGKHNGQGYQDDSRRGGFKEQKENSGQLKLWLTVQIAHVPD